MQTDFNSITVPGSTGDQVIPHGVSNLKALIFFSGVGTSEGNNTDAAYGFGFSDGLSDYSIFSKIVDGYTLGGFTGTRLRLTDTYSICHASGDGTVEVEGSVSAVGSKSFTITWNTVTANRIVYWLAIGGAEISAYTGDFAANTTTGDQSETGVGFQGDSGFFIMGQGVSFPVNNTMSQMRLGAALSSSERFSYNAYEFTFYDPSQATSCYQSDACLLASTTIITDEADFVSWSGDGFTVNWSNAPLSAVKCPYLILKGAQVSLNSFDQATSTGEQTIDSSLGFRPLFSLFMSRGETSAASDLTDDVSMSFGIGRSENQQGVVWAGSLKSQTPTSVSDQYFASTRCISIKEAGTPTLKADAVYTDQAPGSLKVDWQTVDATQRQVDYLVLGKPSPTSGVHFTRGGWG
jgi:hypothetical protein